MRLDFFVIKEMINHNNIINQY